MFVMTAEADESRGQPLSRPWLGVCVTLVGVSTFALVATQELRWLRIGVIAALWAALICAFLATKYRKQVQASEDTIDHAKEVYELELEREVAARREFELEVESEARKRAEADSRDELDALRSEVTALRESLQALFGGEVLYERVALTAQSTRMRSFGEEPRIVNSGEGNGRPAKLIASDGERPTELIDRVVDREPLNAAERRRRVAIELERAQDQRRGQSKAEPTKSAVQPVNRSSPPGDTSNAAARAKAAGAARAEAVRAARRTGGAPSAQAAPATPQTPPAAPNPAGKPAARPSAQQPLQGPKRPATAPRRPDVPKQPEVQAKRQPEQPAAPRTPQQSVPQQSAPQPVQPPAKQPAAPQRAPRQPAAPQQPAASQQPQAPRPAEPRTAYTRMPGESPAGQPPTRRPEPRAKQPEPADDGPGLGLDWTPSWEARPGAEQSRPAGGQPDSMFTKAADPPAEPEKPSRHAESNPTLPPSVQAIQREGRPGGRRRRASEEAETPESPAAEDTGGRRRRADGEAPSWQANAAGTETSAARHGSHESESEPEPDAAPAGRRARPETEDATEGSHAAGRSVEELLAAHGGATGAPHHRRRRSED